MADLIYIIEDDENIRELIQVSLQAFSYEVCSFEAAEPALEEIRRRIPSLVIFDLMLPGIDGLSATQQLRSDPATARLPIIILTAKGKMCIRDSSYDRRLYHEYFSCGLRKGRFALGT